MNEALNQLEDWAEREVISPLIMSRTSQAEAAIGSSARKAKAYSHIYSFSPSLTDEESAFLGYLEHLLSPSAPPSQNQRNDARILFDTKKALGILVTTDGGSKTQPRGILGNREALLKLGVNVLRPEEAVDLIRQKIQERDQRERQMLEMTGESLPEWVGRD